MTVEQRRLNESNGRSPFPVVAPLVLLGALAMQVAPTTALPACIQATPGAVGADVDDSALCIPG